MRFKRLEIENFLSFGSPSQALELDQRGLVAIFGRNLSASNAVSNGAGKSTIFEALVWVLYGTTMRGYSADEVVNNTAKKGCLVRLTIEEDDGKLYVIERTRLGKGKRPNDLRLYVNGNDVSQGVNADAQAMVETIIGMDVSTFTQSVLLSSSGHSFSAMTDKRQKDVLEDILQVKDLSVAQAKAKMRIVEQTNNLIKAKAIVESTTQQLVRDDAQLKGLQRDKDEYAKKVEDRVIDLLQERTRREIALEEACERTGISTLIATENQLRSALAMEETALKTLHASELQIISKASNTTNTLSMEEGRLLGQATALGRQSKGVAALAGKHCPTCHQLVSVDGADATLKHWDTETAAIQATLDKVKALKLKVETDVKKELQDIAEERNTFDKRRRQSIEALQKAHDEVVKQKTLLDEILLCESDIAQLDAEIEKTKKAPNPFDSHIEHKKREIEATKSQMLLASYDQKVAELRIAHLSYWVQAFGNQGIKSYLLDSVVPFLTQRAQYYADLLSGGDLRVSFATQSQTKAGVWKDQFQVCATNRCGANVYAGNSSGEKRKVDLAVGWALGDLAAQRAKKAIRFKGLDEPFENLDPAGEDAVLALLNAVVGQYETILCVTHSADLQAQFSKSMTVVKSNGFSRIVTDKQQGNWNF